VKNRRLDFLVKMIFLSAIYIALVIAVVAAPLRVQSNWSLGSLLTAQASLAAMLIPNTICFLLAAIAWRERWAQLQTPQILIASVFCFGATVGLGFTLAYLSMPVTNLLPVLDRPANFFVMVLPGLIAGQLLRLGPNRIDAS